MTRLCFLCGKKIGFLRSLTDQQYCSSAHRQEARLASAQVMREEEEVESWSVEKSKTKKAAAANATGAPGGHGASIFAFVLVAGLLILAMMLPGPSSGGTSSTPAISLDSGVKRGMLDRAGSAISELIRSSAPVTLHHDFHTGFGDWDTLALRASLDEVRNLASSGSSSDSGRPGTLRLWTRSIPLQNYQMEFQGRIEGRSLNWAFRATDQNNYYASRLVITKSGAQPNASLLRYVVLNGKEFERSTSPLPLTLEKGVDYRVRMSIQDDRFLTYLNGRIIGDWSDRRLHRGGVGFIVEQDDPQQVAWVDVSERDSFLGKMLAHFSFFVIPPGVSR